VTDNIEKPSRTVIGGRHGSPTVTVALPFSNITGADPELRAAVADLALLMSRFARAQGGDADERAAIATAADDLAALLTDG
jgi:hypothetical protein